MLTYIVNQLKAKKIKVVKTKRLPPITINTGSFKFTIIREFLVDNLTTTKIKYAEKIKFVGKTGNRYSVAIGYNPSKALTKAIDHTNELIAFLFYKSGYDGYYLLNLYPDVQTKKIIKSASQFPDFYKVAQKTLNKFKFDLYVFWGSSVYVSFTLSSMLNSLSQDVYTIGATNGSNAYLHKHPGRHVNFSTINANIRSKPLQFTNKNCGYLK